MRNEYMYRVFNALSTRVSFKKNVELRKRVRALLP